jgi:hypothetical protein
MLGRIGILSIMSFSQLKRRASAARVTSRIGSVSRCRRGSNSPRRCAMPLPPARAATAGGQAADRRDLRPEVAADHVGVDHRFAHHAMGGVASIDSAPTSTVGMLFMIDDRIAVRSRCPAPRPRRHTGRSVQQPPSGRRSGRRCAGRTPPGTSPARTHDLPRRPRSTSRVEIRWPRAATPAAARRPAAATALIGTPAVVEPEEAHQQQRQHPPAGDEGGAVMDRHRRRLELGQVVVGGMSRRKNQSSAQRGGHRTRFTGAITAA